MSPLSGFRREPENYRPNDLHRNPRSYTVLIYNCERPTFLNKDDFMAAIMLKVLCTKIIVEMDSLV